MRRSRLVAIDAVLFALIVLFTIISAAIPTGIVSIAFLMLLPVLAAAQVERFSTAVFAGAVLGIMSLITAFIFPKPTSSLFYNPLVSVLPRMIIGAVSWLVFRYTNKALSGLKIKNSVKFTLTSVLSACIGVITNTAMVLCAVWLIFNGEEVGGMIIDAAFITGLLSINFVIEIIMCAILTPPVVYALKRSLKQPCDVNGFAYTNKSSKSISVSLTDSGSHSANRSAQCDKAEECGDESETDRSQTHDSETADKGEKQT